ncbi:MAG: flagellar motor switch protein FliM [Vicinamibacterales bacterium]
MSKILTQDEIDVLLTSVSKIDKRSTAVDEEDDEGKVDSVVAYNFRRPDRISKDQIRSLHFLHDRFARNVTTSLSAYLRAVTDFSIASVEQFTYSEFLMSLPDPTAFYALSMDPLDIMAALELNPNVAFSMIDRMLGGSGRIATLQRALTEIEQNVVDAVVKLIVENLTEAWRSIVEVQFKVTGRETRPQMLQVAAPNEVVVQLGFDMRLGDARGMLNLCVPATAIEAVGASFAQTWHRFRREPTAADRRSLHDNLLQVVLAVEAGLESQLRARDLITLRPGDVLSLGCSVAQPVNVRVRGSSKFNGRLRASGQRATLRIDELNGASAVRA